MRLTIALLAMAGACVLAGCGSKDSESGGPAAAPPAASKSNADSRVAATAEENAKAARGKLKCPAKVATPERAADAPVDDVVGVRPGMTIEDAEKVVMCTNDLLVVQEVNDRGFRINTYGQTVRWGFNARFAVPTINKTSKEILQEMQDRTISSGGNAVVHDMQPGQAKWYVGTVGMPGQEKVFSAAREEWFLEGKQPTMASIAQALMKKYGEPSSDRDQGAQRVISWVSDPLGRHVPETSSLSVQCRGVFDPDQGVGLSPDCGIVVMADIVALRDNQDLAQYLQVGVVDQSNGYEWLQATAQGLEAMDAQRRADEVKKAEENAEGPQL